MAADGSFAAPLSRRAPRVVLADDDVLLREGLARLLDRPGFDVVGQAGDGAELLALGRHAGHAGRGRHAHPGRGTLQGRDGGRDLAGGLPGRHRVADFMELAAMAIANAKAEQEMRELADTQAALRRLATLVARGEPPR